MFCVRLIIIILLIQGFEVNAQVMQKRVFESFHSEFVLPRRVDVYLPPDYPAGAPYQVLYMHDGQNLSDPSTSTHSIPWKADSALLALMEDGSIKPCILVGIWNTPKRYQEYAPQPAFTSLSDSTVGKIIQEYGELPYSDLYLKFLVNELKPFIDKEFLTNPLAGSTAIAGSSMGGLISLYALCSYPEVFGRAACVSIHWPILTRVKDKTMFSLFKNWLSGHLPQAGGHVIYMDRGTETLDSLYAPYMEEIEQLFAEKVVPATRYSIRAFEGAAHDEASWAIRFPEVVKYLFQP
jgi:enterochelin esterase-like enzyme